MGAVEEEHRLPGELDEVFFDAEVAGLDSLQEGTELHGWPQKIVESLAANHHPPALASAFQVAIDAVEDESMDVARSFCGGEDTGGCSHAAAEEDDGHTRSALLHPVDHGNNVMLLLPAESDSSPTTGALSALVHVEAADVVFHEEGRHGNEFTSVHDVAVEADDNQLGLLCGHPPSSKIVAIALDVHDLLRQPELAWRKVDRHARRWMQAEVGNDQIDQVVERNDPYQDSQDQVQPEHRIECYAAVSTPRGLCPVE